MVHLSLGNVPAALADLESALASGPNPVKYFHLARAHLANNNRDAAAEAFDQARNAGLNPKTVPYLEMQAYEQLNQDFPPKVSASTN
jgi:tetratricopeptide (TPR) repeat protein